MDAVNRLLGLLCEATDTVRKTKSGSVLQRSHWCGRGKRCGLMCHVRNLRRGGGFIRGACQRQRADWMRPRRTSRGWFCWDQSPTNAACWCSSDTQDHLPKLSMAWLAVPAHLHGLRGRAIDAWERGPVVCCRRRGEARQAGQAGQAGQGGKF
jgi:hypothetical protein